MDVEDLIVELLRVQRELDTGTMTDVYIKIGECDTRALSIEKVFVDNADDIIIQVYE